MNQPEESDFLPPRPTLPLGPLGLRRELEQLRDRLQMLAENLDRIELHQEEDQDALGHLGELMGQVDKQVQRAGKEQFKANTLLENLQKQVTTAVTALKQAEGLQEAERRRLQGELESEGKRRRQEIFIRFLPILDSLEEALNQGRRLLKENAETSPEIIPSFTTRCRQAWRHLLAYPLESKPRILFPPAMEDWLHGLELLRQRMLALLSEEGIQPIEALGQDFDPHLHHAFESLQATSAFPPGTIQKVLRKGYQIGSGILRYAEVIVSK